MFSFKVKFYLFYNIIILYSVHRNNIVDKNNKPNIVYFLIFDLSVSNGSSNNDINDNIPERSIPKSIKNAVIIVNISFCYNVIILYRE